ncbi:MAG: hypothetical protein UH071_10295, partial [Paludibacteraceae bacterium]|nr:hypothetical protein [Paludibacteraceae bacterium]
YKTATSSCGNNISYTQSIDPATPVYSSTSVTVTAKDFCHADGVDQVINLVVPTPISIENVSSTSVKCKGDGDGTITIGNIVGGKETYHYFYKKASDDDFTEVNEKTVSNLIAGDYVLRVVDANGCYNNKNINVSEPSIVTLTATPTNAECHGSKGKITVAANGGNGGTYIYKYGTASDNIDTQFTSDSELPANKYYVQAFDVKGCKSAVVDVTITQPAEFNPGTIESAGQTICYGSPVNAIKSAATATSIPSATISYRWILEQGGAENEIAGATGVSYTPNVTDPGTYKYYREAKDDKCMTEWVRSAGSWTLVINQNPVPTLSVPSNVCANAEGKYTISVSVSDQTGNYTYSHLFSDNVTIAGADTSVVAANKCGGAVSYNVEITNETTGCKGTDSKTFSITTPTIAFTDEAKAAANIHLKPQSIGNCTFVVPVLDNSNLGVYEEICDVVRTCGFGNVTYSIKENIGGQNILGKPVQMTIVASDACVSDEITVYVDKPEPLILSGTPKDSSICLYSTTDVTFTVSGGTSPYTYNLESPSQMPSGMTFSGDEAKNVVPGEYSFSVTDNDGCTSAPSKVKVGTYTDFKVAPSLETTGQTICSEDAPNPIKVVNAESYGSAEFIYEWYKNEVLPGNKIDNATSAEFIPRNNVLTSGETQIKYDDIVVVKDQCSGKESRLRYTLTVNPLPEVNLTANDGCESTTFNADVDGITNNYNFYWSETNQAGSFALGAATKTLSLPAAVNQVSKTYYVKAENATTKCVSKQSVEKTATVYRKPSISIGEIALVCPKNGDNPGSAVEMPVTSIIGTIDGVKDGDANVSYTYENDTIVLTDNISAGKKFTVTVKNGDVCVIATKDVDVFVYTAPEFNVSDWTAICQGESMENLPVVSVTWNDNVADKNNRSESWYNGSAVLSADQIKDLSAGNYVFTYKAINGCGLETSKQIQFNVNQNPVLTATVNTPNVCGNTGIISVSTNNGSAPYSYTINGTSVSVENGTIKHLSPNTYSIEVTDDNGCKNSVDGLVIASRSALNAGSLKPVTSFCSNEDVTPKFEFETAPSGGSKNYIYKWTKGTETTVLGTEASYTPSLPKENGKYIPGTYTYTVTVLDEEDQECGTVSLPAVVVIKPQPGVVLSPSSEKSCDQDVVFTAMPFGANTGVSYQYDWNDDEDGFGNINEKTYSLPVATASLNVSLSVVVRAQGCESEPASASATIYASPVLGDFVNPSDLCANKEYYNVSVNLKGGYTIGENQYTWKNGDQSFGNSSAAVIPEKNSCGAVYNYSVSVKNTESGCVSAVKSGSFTTSISESTIKDAADISPITLTNGANCEFAIPFDAIKNAVGFQTSCGLIASNWSFKIAGTEVNSDTRINSDKDVLVTVTDGCDREVHTTVSLKAPSPLEWNGDQTIVDVDCKGNSTGQITLSVKGGVEPYYYSKSPRETGEEEWQSSNMFDNLKAGAYTMTARDVNGCIIDIPLTVSEPAKSLSATISGNATVCKDETSPVKVVVSGGTAPYTVTVATQTIVGDATQTEFVFDLTANTYTAEVVDSKNCSYTTSSSVTISEYVGLKSAAQFVNNPASQTICEGQIKKQISVTASSYKDDALTYTWKKDSVIIDNNLPTHTPLETAVGVYKYTVSVYDGCTKKTYDINEPYVFTINKKPTVEITVPEGSNCDGSDVVLSTVTNKVGNEPYEFKWNDKSTAETLTVTTSGTYSVKVTLGECSASASKTISMNSRPANPTLTVSKETSCEEKIIFTASGAKTGETYVWKHNGEPKNITSSTTHIDYVGGENTQAVIGEWTVQIKDSKGCLSEQAATKKATIYKKPTFDIIVPTEACPTADNYPLSINVGYAAENNYSVTWSSNVMPDNQTPTKATINKASDQCGYTYSFNVSVEDIHCKTTLPGSFTTKKSEASDLNLTINPDVYDLVGTDCIFRVPEVTTKCTFSTICDIETATITQSVSAGDVIAGSKKIVVTATDLCGTSVTKEVTLNVPSNNLSGKTLSASVTNVKCNGNNNGEVTLSVAGMTSDGYTYYLTDNNHYSDNNTNGEFSNVPVGTYSGKVVDANGCSLTNSNIKVSQPTPFTATIPTALSVCPGAIDGSIVITDISGGTAPYSVTVDGATVSAVSEGKSTVSGLKKGKYTITVKDNNDCSVVKTLTVSEFDKPDVTITGAASVCEGNSVTLTAKPNTNAAPTVIYSWVKSNDTPADGAYSTFNAGASKTVTAPIDWNGKTEYSETWYVKVKDGHGCISDATSATATIMKRPEVTLTQDGFKCEETVTFTATSASATSYSWKKNNETWSEYSAEDSKTLNYVDANTSVTWYVKAKNEQGCESDVKEATGYVYKKPAVSIVGDVTTLCEQGSLSGELSSNADFNTYSWKKDDVEIGNEKTYTATAPGSYTLTVTDDHCTNTSVAHVISKSAFAIESVTAVNPKCHSGLGSIEVKVKDGAADYQYVLNAGTPVEKSDAHHTFADVAAGSYTVTITDGNGCVVTKDGVIITIPTELKIDAWSAANAEVCAGDNADITLKVSGGTAPYRYKVNTDDVVSMGDGISSATISKSQGSYSVEVIDQNDCKVTSVSNVVITKPSDFTSGSLDKSETNVCAGSSNPEVKVVGSASAKSCSDCITYKWTKKGSDDLLGTSDKFTSNETDPGTYEYVVTVSDGCSGTSKNLDYKHTINPNPTFILSELGEQCPKINTENYAISVSSVTPSTGYSVVWTGATKDGSDQTKATIAGGDCSGTKAYSATVTNIATGCSTKIDKSLEIKLTNALALSLTTDGLKSGTTTDYEFTLTSDKCEFTTPTFTYTATQNCDIIPEVSQSENGDVVTVTATDFCGNEISKTVKIITPVAPSAPSLTAETVCGEDVTFTASGANTGETYLWSNTADGTFVAGESTKKLTYNANGDKIQSATWYVKVKNANGCESEATNATGKTYVPPVATIASALGQCSYTLSANLTGNAYSYVWSGKMDGNESTIVADESGTYDLVITEKYSDNHECSSTKVSETITISDVTMPTISYTKACVGQDATLNLTNTVDGYTYDWEKKVGTSTTFVSAGTGLSINTKDAGEYRVKVTSAQNCTKTTDAIAVEFHSLPTPQIVKVDANDYLCADGKALTLKTSDEYESYKWSTTATTAMIDVTTAGDYTVEVTDDNNCKATSEKFSVALHSLPVLDEIADQTVCVDAKANFTLTLATATEGEYTYNVSTVNPQTSDAFSLGKGNYSATVTDKYGCTSEAKSFKVEEYAWTAATLASSSQTICKENLSDLSAITVNATTNGAAGSLTYSWTLPTADNSALPTGNTHTPAVEEVGTYTYNVIVNDACTKGKTDNLTYTLTINAAPTISDLTALSAVCEGSSFTLPIVSSVANGSVITSEGWKYNDGGVWKDFVNNNLQPGSYTLKYVVTNGCGTAERELAQAVEVSAASAIAVTPQTAKICKDIQPVLNVTSITGNITKITANGVALDPTDYAYDITGKKITLPAISEKTTYVVTVKNGACDEKDASATVDVYSAPVIGDVTLP